MKSGKFTLLAAALLLSLLGVRYAAEAQIAASQHLKAAASGETPAAGTGPMVFTPTARPPARQFDWKKQIVTTVFWIGERPTANNPVPNRASSWDKNWTANYGGYENPDKTQRAEQVPGGV